MEDIFPHLKKVDFKVTDTPGKSIAARISPNCLVDAVVKAYRVAECSVQESAEMTIAAIRNLMFQRTHLVHRLKEAETLWTFMASDMDGREELSAALEEARREAATAKQTTEADAALVQEAESKAGFFSMKADGLEAKLSNQTKEKEELQRDYDKLTVEKMEADNEVTQLKAKLQQAVEMAAAENAKLM